MRGSRSLAFVIAAASIVVLPSLAFGQLGHPLVQPVEVITFDGYEGSGLASPAGPGEISTDYVRVFGIDEGPTDWGMGPYDATGYAQGSSTGGESGGGLYSFIVPGPNGPIFGWQGTENDMTPGDIFIALRNDTGAPIDFLSFNWEI